MIPTIAGYLCIIKALAALNPPPGDSMSVPISEQQPCPRSDHTPPARVRGNDWKALGATRLDSFTPDHFVTVVIPYYERSHELNVTLAGLERQTYPRDLFEVVVVDDGSDPPLVMPETPLNLRVEYQEDLGFGLARARNTGARAATGDIILFLDCDMIPEEQWLAAHARWHHAASDVLTMGFRFHVEAEGLGAADVRRRPGTLAELFDGREVTRPEWIEVHLARTGELTSDDDDLFRVVTGGNFGISRAFFETVGGFDETFTQWGAEDREFAYRAYTLGVGAGTGPGGPLLASGCGSDPHGRRAAQPRTPVRQDVAAGRPPRLPA